MQNSKTISELHELITKQQWDKITDKDWEMLLATLSEKCDWEQMWRLAQIAPVMWSVRLLLRLKEASWMPEQDAERAAFTQLLQLLENGWQGGVHSLKEDVFSCYVTLTGHTGGVTCVAINPDGKLLVSGSSDKTVRLWNLPNGTTLQTLQGHTCDLTCLVFSHDGRVLEIGRSNGSLWLWSPEAPKKLQDEYTYKGAGGMKKKITCLAISPDGGILASGECLWEEYWDHEAALTGWSLDRIIVTPDSVVHTVRLWSLPDGMLLHQLEEHTHSINCLAISPDGQVLASGNYDGTIQVWNLPDGVASQTLEWRTKWRPLEVTCIAFSPDGRLLAAGARGDRYDKNTVRLWSLPDGEILQTLGGHTGSGISWVAISPDGRILASRSHGDTVRLWSLPDGKLLHTLRGQTWGIICLAFSPDGHILASGSRDGAIRLWALWKVRLRRLISEPTCLEHLELVEDILKKEEVTHAERKWLEFLLAVMRWQQQFDVEIGEVPQSISGGEFDMEVS